MLTIPPLEITKRFLEFVKPLDDKIDANNAAINTLASLRDNLLPKLMSGEVRVKDVEKES